MATLSSSEGAAPHPREFGPVPQRPITAPEATSSRNIPAHWPRRAATPPPGSRRMSPRTKERHLEKQCVDIDLELPGWIDHLGDHGCVGWSDLGEDLDDVRLADLLHVRSVGEAHAGSHDMLEACSCALERRSGASRLSRQETYPHTRAGRRDVSRASGLAGRLRKARARALRDPSVRRARAARARPAGRAADGAVARHRRASRACDRRAGRPVLRRSRRASRP